MTSPSPALPAARAPRGLNLLARSLLLLWAGFWIWFVAVDVFSEPSRAAFGWGALWLVSLGLLVLLCWTRPLWGGLLLGAAGVWAASCFDNASARALLAAPAIALGLAFALIAWRNRRGAALALASLALFSLGSCLTPQDPRDAPYRSGSFLWHANGQRQRARLLEPTEIDGFPCAQWVWWHANGRLDSLELARDFEFQGIEFPQGTRLFLDAEGRLAHAWLAHACTIDGYVCRGRFKIDTAFHPNGRLRAFFPPEDIEIDGLCCEASLFHPVYLHEDGRLREARLARDARVDGADLRAGATVRLDSAGHRIR